MFTKDAEKLESFVGANAQLKGEMHVKGTLRVDGSIEGQVQTDCLVLSETGQIKGDVTALKMVIGGRVEGNLKAKEIVEIQAKGKVLGEIFTKKLAVQEGGEFNGRIEMKAEESKIIDFEAKAKD